MREWCHPISNPLVVDIKKLVREGLGLNARRIKQIIILERESLVY